MAVVSMEGWDHEGGVAAQIPAKQNRSGTPQTPGTTGRFGTGLCLDHNGTNSTTSIILPGSYTTLYIGVAINMAAGLVTNSSVIQLLNGGAGGTVVASIQFTPSGPNTVMRVVNAASTVIGTGTATFVVDTWRYIELKCVVSATVGQIETRLDAGTSPDINVTNVNTGALAIDTITLRQFTGRVRYDDFYAVDTTGSSPTNAFLGEVRIETIAPTGNGANTAWTGAFGDWDDGTSHDTDSTYVSSSTPGDRETSTLSDLSVATGTVFAVQTVLTARKDDAGARTIAPVIRIGGVNYDGTTTAGLTAGYIGYTQIYDRLDPSGAAWTIATVNGMEAGAKEVA